MKTQLIKHYERISGILLISLMFLGIVLSAGCKKSSDPETPPTPPDAQLIGAYSGLTSQNDTILISVSNVNGVLKITRYAFTVKFTNPPGVRSIDVTDSDGISSVVNRYFTFLLIDPGSPGDEYLNGTFNISNLTLNGAFMVYPSFSTTGAITVTYTAAKLPQ